MKVLQLYFGSIDEVFCQPLDGFIHDAKLEELKEITLIEAIPDNDTSNVIWCKHYGDCVERNECKKSLCGYYESKGGGRGVCKHRGSLYLHGKEVKFNVETGEQITT